MTWSAQQLEGNTIDLVPLEAHHLDPLWSVAQHEEIWRYMPFRAATYAQFGDFFSNLLKDQSSGRSMPFATRLRATGEFVGSTSFLALNPHHRTLEIGATWITPAHQRSVVNTEAKLLQLSDAFERLGCNRVELKTDSLNQKSQAAIARIGGVEEGTFRNHMVMPDGRLRHTVWFSITKQEWPEVKLKLEARTVIR